jgi:hypothetical protein
LINARPKDDLLNMCGPSRQAFAIFNSVDRLDLCASAKGGQHAAVRTDFQ